MSNYGKEPAFPVISENKNVPYAVGLTKLEHFAGLAMQGIIANEYVDDNATFESVAIRAFLQAKAMCDEAERRSK